MAEKGMFSGVPRYLPSQRSSGASSSQNAGTPSARGLGLGSGSQNAGTPSARGLGLGSGPRGLGLGKGRAQKRHRKIHKDNIQGITKGDIRRMARRGGVKRISATVYSDVRVALKNRLELVLKQVTALCEYQGRKTVTVRDVIFVLNRLGRPIYGFDT